MPPNASRLRPAQTLLVGSLLFGLYFGAGNLVFPVGMGRDAGSATPLATVGFLLTAVGLPIVGIVAAALSGTNDVLEMVRPAGRRYALAFTCALYLTIGPLFAIPRTATVSYEVGFAPFVPEGARHLALAAFSLAFFGVTALAALRPGRLMDWVGRYLTPIFLVLLGALVVASFVRPMATGPLHAPTGAYATSPLTQGLLDGYNTMDALASLAYAIAVIEAVRRLGVDTRAGLAREIAKGGVVCLVAMSVVYASLAYVGATSRSVTPDADNGGAVLAGVSQHYFGGAGQVLIAGIVLFACVKTSIGLVTSCAEMFERMFPGRLSYRAWVLLFSGVSCVIANFGLVAIIAWSIPVLVFLYPLVITAIVLALLTRQLRHRPVVHRVMTAFVAVAALFDLVKALPVQNGATTALTGLAGRVLPGYSLGFGWLVPAVLGLLLGLVLSHRTTQQR